MEPIGPLMWEHRTIERAVELMEKELEKIQKTGKIDYEFDGQLIHEQYKKLTDEWEEFYEDLGLRRFRYAGT